MRGIKRTTGCLEIRFQNPGRDFGYVKGTFRILP